MTTKPVFAIDVGGCLASKYHDGAPVADSLHVIQQLNDTHDLWIVSQCGKMRARETKKWLYYNDFDSIIPESKQVYIGFDEHNKNRVLTELNAAYFVDDRPKHIIPAIKLGCIQAAFHMSEYALYDLTPTSYKHVRTWLDIMSVLLGKEVAHV